MGSSHPSVGLRFVKAETLMASPPYTTETVIDKAETVTDYKRPFLEASKNARPLTLEDWTMAKAQ